MAEQKSISQLDHIEWLQGYYFSLCDGEWEHGYGFKIGTLDNPGWTFEFDVTGTPLENLRFEDLQINRSEDDWLLCRVEHKKFQAYCGPLNLGEVITVFRQWVEDAK